MYKALLIDGNPFLWRAAHSSPMESVANKVLIYFFEVVGRFSSDAVVVCWDQGKSRWRSSLFEDYKAQRLQQKKDSDLDLQALEEQKILVRKYLSSIGVRQVLVPGLEADDMLAWLSDYFKMFFRWEVIISTGDRDLWQLVDEHVSIWDPQKQILVNPALVEEHFGVPPSRVADFKSLVGDPSDNLPGVKQVGEKTATLLLGKYGSLGALLDPANSKDLGEKKTTARVLPEGDFLGEMYRLVKIPSLKESAECLTAEEHQILVGELTGPLTRDAFKSQVLSERIGSSFLTYVSALPQVSADLSGMLQQMERSPMQKWSSLRDVDLAISACSACPLRWECVPEGPVYPEGAENRKIMVIGRNPGRQEREHGRPFYSEAPAGERLNKFLAESGIDRDECWVTNVCKCYSTDDRPPTYPEIMACLPYLRAEIDFLKPRLILAFGNEAMMAVTPYKTRVTKHCGEILENPEGLVGKVDAYVGICVHPSAALRSEQNERDMEYASKVVKEFLERKTHHG